MLDDITKRQPLLKSGVVFLYDTIDNHTFPEIVASLVEARSEDRPIKLYITSHGGYADVAMALHDFVKGFGRIHTYLFGVVESAAVTIFAAGEQRFVTPYSGIGLHSSYTSGISNVDAKSSLLHYERSKILDDQYALILAGISTQDRNWWRQILGKGVAEVTHIIDAKTLVDYGMAKYAETADYLITRPPPAPAKTEPVAVSEPPPVQPGQGDTPPRPTELIGNGVSTPSRKRVYNRTKGIAVREAAPQAS